MWALALVAWLQLASSAFTPVHVVFLTDCTMYSNWQSLGMMWSWRMSGQPGTLSRVMCCTPEEKAKYDTTLQREVETWVAPSFTIHPRTGDNYAAYNKPEAVIDWLEHVTPKEEYVLVLDSDMILRKPFLVEEMHPSPGWAVGARYTYMIGVANELADRHIPEVPKRNDTFAGPMHRRADQVGGFFFIHRDDLKRMSKLWLKYTEDVRNDTEAYRLSGDVYAIHPGDKPWISEMYGYAFGAAKSNVWHHWDSTSMIYPQYEPHGIPKLLHYGLLFEVDKYKFDKHWHYDFDVTKCAPWDLSNPSRATAGIFPPPPHPSTLKNQDNIVALYRDLLSIETVAMLNAGFCDYHLRHCPPHTQLLAVCTEALQLYIATEEAIAKAEKEFKCTDWHTKCSEWAKEGECEQNKEYMEENCLKSCNKCDSKADAIAKPQPTETLELLEKLRKALGDAGSGATTIGAAKTTTTATATATNTAQQQAVASPKAAATTTTTTDTNNVQQQQAVAKPVASSPPPVVVQAQSPKELDEATKQILREAMEGKKDIVDTIRGKGGRNALLRKDFLVRCYRMTLTLDEVKACVEAAREGKAYVHPRTGKSSADASAPVGGGDGSDLLSDPEGGADGEGETAEERRARRVSHHRLIKDDIGDKSRRKALDEGVVAPASHKGSGLTTWQAAGLWVVVVAAFLLAVPKISKLRRRQRSGQRIE